MVRLSTSPREAAPLPPASIAVASLKVVELRAELSGLGLPTTGRKAELAARLTAAQQDKENTSSSSSSSCSAAAAAAAAVAQGYLALAKDPALALAPEPEPRSPLRGAEGATSAAARRPLAFAQNSNPADVPRVRPPVPLFRDNQSSAPSGCVSLIRGGSFDEYDDDACTGGFDPDDELVPEDHSERIQAMEEGMEETLADMEKLDAQLAVRERRVQRLENELVAAKEETAQVWGSTITLRKRASECAEMLQLEQDARRKAERLLEEYQQQLQQKSPLLHPDLLRATAGALLSVVLGCLLWMRVQSQLQ
jgi:hypothetical protein